MEQVQLDPGVRDLLDLPHALHRLILRSVLSVDDKTTASKLVNSALFFRFRWVSDWHLVNETQLVSFSSYLVCVGVSVLTEIG